MAGEPKVWLCQDFLKKCEEQSRRMDEENRGTTALPGVVNAKRVHSGWRKQHGRKLTSTASNAEAGIRRRPSWENTLHLHLAVL